LEINNFVDLWIPKMLSESPENTSLGYLAFQTGKDTTEKEN